MKTSRSLLLIAVLINASCGGGSSNSAGAGGAPAPVPAPTISHAVGSNTYEWRFTCGGANCLVGRFISGDYWVAPSVLGQEVKLTSVTTTGTSAGIEINPTNPSKQGFLSCLAASYDATLDRTSSLPLTVAPNSSIVKATSVSDAPNNVCGPAGATCCIDSFDVVTVMASPPANSDSAFRPPFAGADKPIRYISDFDLTRIPSLQSVTDTGTVDFNAVKTRWFLPYVDHYMWKLGDIGGAFAPQGIPYYGADVGKTYLQDLIRVMGSESGANKLPAVAALLQRGSDLYGSYKAGIIWPSGAGQQVGRKPPVVFFASMLVDPAVKDEVRTLAANNGDSFHEDGQIKINVATGNVPVWGDTCTEGEYWAQLFKAQNYEGAAGPVIGTGDNSRTCGDPYGRIDGPAGLPGTFYMECCSTGPFIGYQVAQSLMPQLCAAANDPELSAYTRRIIASGVITQPDACAPPDPGESRNCQAHRLDPATNGCLYYMTTWGPDPANPGDCIRNQGSQTGRFTSRHGAPISDPLYEPPIARTLRTLTPGILGACN